MFANKMNCILGILKLGAALKSVEGPDDGDRGKSLCERRHGDCKGKIDLVRALASGHCDGVAIFF
jgi:hypothetical protein